MLLSLILDIDISLRRFVIITVFMLLIIPMEVAEF